MNRLLTVIAAASLMLPALSMAQTPPKGHAPPTTHKAAPVKPGPGARPAARPIRPAVRPAARPGRPGRPGRVVGRPLPPRGNQFFHRGHAFARIHGPAYAYPRGWHYRRWGIGGLLPALFLTSAYYYNDWAALELQAPAPGYQWVRFGPDLLLVNLATGQVEDAVYGVFL